MASRISLDSADTILWPEKPRKRFSWKKKLLAATACCFIAWLGFVFVTLSHFGKHDQTSDQTDTYAAQRYSTYAVQRYAGEKVTWKVCGDSSGHTLECTNLTVPMDHFDTVPDGKDKTFSIPLIRLRSGKETAQNLLLNPGGPGGSGQRLLYLRGSDLREVVGEDFHLLSFDPRGVNGSVPRGICYPDDETRKQLSVVRTTDAVYDSAEMYGWAKNFVQACKDTMGEHGAYLTTPQTAADMNSILDAVGQEDMNYWGFSYGSTLGQTYAQMFPERSRRIVIDGVSNSFHWYGRDFDSVHYVDTENALHGFFEECIKAQKNCSLSSLGDTAEQLYQMVVDLGERLKKQPISVYVNNTSWGLLTHEHILFNAILPALYRPSRWYELADNLAKLLKGNATAAWLAYAGKAAFELGDDSSDFIFNNDAQSGPNYWTQDRDSFLSNTILPIVNVSIFGPGENLDYYTKQQWKVPRTINFFPQKSVKTAHPILLVSMSIDPTCPLVSAQTAQQVFEDSRLLEIKGVGHCSVSVTSTCAAKHIRAYLAKGTLPKESHVECPVDGPYFVAPEEIEVQEMNKIVARSNTLTDLSEQEEKVYRAQVNLARNWEWKVRRGGLGMPVF